MDIKIGAVVRVGYVKGNAMRAPRRLDEHDVVVIDRHPDAGKWWAQMLDHPAAFVIVANGRGREKGRLVVHQHQWGADAVDCRGRAAAWPAARVEAAAA